MSVAVDGPGCDGVEHWDSVCGVVAFILGAVVGATWIYAYSCFGCVEYCKLIYQCSFIN